MRREELLPPAASLCWPAEDMPFRHCSYRSSRLYHSSTTTACVADDNFEAPGSTILPQLQLALAEYVDVFALFYNARRHGRHIVLVAKPWCRSPPKHNAFDPGGKHSSRSLETYLSGAFILTVYMCSFLKWRSFQPSGTLSSCLISKKLFVLSLISP